MKKVLKDPLTVLFVVSAVLVAVDSGIDKNIVGVIWPLLAACFCLLTALFKQDASTAIDRALGLIEENIRLISENMRLKAELKKLTNKEETTSNN